MSLFGPKRCIHSEWERDPFDRKYQKCKQCGWIVPIDCAHRWITLKEEPLYKGVSANGVPYGMVGYHLIQQCEHCGTIQDKKVSI